MMMFLKLVLDDLYRKVITIFSVVRLSSSYFYLCGMQFNAYSYLQEAFYIIEYYQGVIEQ